MGSQTGQLSSPSPGTGRQTGGFVGRLMEHGRRSIWQQVIDKAPGNSSMSGKCIRRE